MAAGAPVPAPAEGARQADAAHPGRARVVRPVPSVTAADFIPEAEYDTAFRLFLKTILRSPPAVCARCGRTLATHVCDGYIGAVDHDFTPQSVN